MPCPTCDQTMQRVNDGTPAVFWCPTCGTLRQIGATADADDFRPRLISRSTMLAQAIINFCFDDNGAGVPRCKEPFRSWLRNRIQSDLRSVLESAGYTRGTLLDILNMKEPNSDG